MKNLAVFTLTLAISSMAFAVDESHLNYGWDILCKGPGSLTVHAYQADDDFYVDVQSKTISKQRIWLDTSLESDMMDDRNLNLLFVGNEKLSDGKNIALSVTRASTQNNVAGAGMFYYEETINPVNCFVRFGHGEDDFDEISKKPFPKVEPAKKLPNIDQQNSSTGIYGWDILCKGADGLVAHARQSDDDFYIDVKSKKIQKKISPWADSQFEMMDRRVKSLLFVGNYKMSDGNAIALSVIRKSMKNESFATGMFYLNEEMTAVNCFVRYGTDEESFFDISQKKFPKVTPAKRLQNF